MTKKILFLALAVVLSLALVACGAASSDYSSWTKAEWDAATDEQKLEVAEKVVIEIGEQTMEGYAQIHELAKSDPEQAAQIESSLEDMAASIDMYFEAFPDSTIGAMVDASLNMLGAAQ